MKVRLTVGITGATGAIFGIRMLERLRTLQVETHLVMSKWAERTIEHETSYSVADVRALASVVHGVQNQAAEISSGSFLTEGMIIAPCSVKTLAAIAVGLADNLVHRAADVTLKERRKLILMVRETPFNDIHLENMLKLSRMGAVIFPPVPAFYNHPKSMDDMVDHIVARALDQMRLNDDWNRRWDGQLTRTTE